MIFTYRLSKEELQDYKENTLDIDEIITELLGEIVDKYVETGEREIKIYLTKYAGYSDKYCEEYEDEIDVLHYNINEILREYLGMDEVLDLLESVIYDNMNYKIKLNELLSKLKGD